MRYKTFTSYNKILMSTTTITNLDLVITIIPSCSGTPLRITENDPFVDTVFPSLDDALSQPHQIAHFVFLKFHESIENGQVELFAKSFSTCSKFENSKFLQNHIRLSLAVQ